MTIAPPCPRIRSAAVSVAGQIAKLRGSRVIGIAGGPDKCRWVTGTAKLDAATTVVGLEAAIGLADDILAGKVQGRTVIDVNA